MNTECNQFVFGFHPLKQREIRAHLTVGPSRPKEAGCCCEKSRNASESCASLPPASGIIGIQI